MSLLPLQVFDNLRRLCAQRRSRRAAEAAVERLVERLVASASLIDAIRWRSTSRAFHAAAQKRLDAFTRIHVRTYDGLRTLYSQRNFEKVPSSSNKEEMCWHPSACLLFVEMDASTLGLAIDSRADWKDVRALIAALCTFRRRVSQVFLDSPIIEILVAEVNNQKVNALLTFLSRSRAASGNAGATAALRGDLLNQERCVAPMHECEAPNGPFFPALKQLVVTSDAKQLSHLSRLLNYSVAVDLIYHTAEVELVSLRVLLGGSSWCGPRQRLLFRHLHTFRQWSEADRLGVRYLQQFTNDLSRGPRRKHRLL